MKSNIDAKYYYQEDIFKKEQQMLFSKTWNFIGFKSSLVNDNDFITKNIGGIPVVIQNFKGTIKSFLNVCSHRFSIIQQETTGNRPLMCPYHGWAYNKEGIPTGIPKKPMFKNFSKEELCELKLKEFKVAFCGNLCFLSLQDATESLSDFLGDFHDELELISLSIGDLIDINQMQLAANWKIIVENTLEGYHVNLVHASSLLKLKPTSDLTFEFSKNHSNWIGSFDIDRTVGGYKKVNSYYSPRSYDIEGYKHILIFPNLLISSTHGISYNFSLIEPIDAENTSFTSYVFVNKSDKDKEPTVIKGFKESLIDFNRQVFDEDKTACELVQKGVAYTQHQGMLSLEEERVHHFQKVYLKIINDGC